MSEILIYLFLALFTLVFALPLYLSLRVYRPTPTAAITVEIRFGIYRILAGIALAITGRQRLLHILFFNRQLPIPPLDLTAKPTATTSAQPDPEPRPVQTDAQDASPTTTTKRDTLLLLRSIARPMLQFFIRFPRAFYLGELKVRGRFGFADPVQTGSLYGYLQALRALPFKRVHFDLTPDFCTRGTCGQMHLTLHIHLGFIIAQCIRLIAQAGWRYLAMRFRFAKPRFI